MGLVLNNIHVPKDDLELLRYFESLGENCEFGFVQRCVGLESPSLFRFNFIINT